MIIGEEGPERRHAGIPPAVLQCRTTRPWQVRDEGIAVIPPRQSLNAA
jgi:hypothetical protein